MDLSSIMEKKNWVVAGDTLNPEKYAFIIKKSLLMNSYSVEAVGKEKKSLDEVEGDIEVLDLCIHPVKGLALLTETKKKIGCVLIQPGAGSKEIEEYLSSKGIPYLDGCALKGLKAKGCEIAE